MSEIKKQMGLHPGEWFIEYEIPPLRAIYHARGSSTATRKMIVAACESMNPPWKIRKLRRVK